MNCTHTYVLMELSAEAYDEIAAHMSKTDYSHALGEHGEIDMNGIAVMRGAPRPVFKTHGNTNIGMERVDAVGGEGCKATISTRQS